jgi:hypothetical protein
MQLKRYALRGILAAVGLVAVSAGASAQYYYPAPPPQRYYYQQPQVYVPPRVARKQEQLRQRYIQKYGYTPPQYQYYPQQPGYYYDPQPRFRRHYGYGGGYYYGGVPLPNSNADIGSR